MTKVLGLDLGTNSIGWAVVEESENGYRLLDQGVDIFQEGVARDKNNEKPAVQDRTTARASRRHYFRRRLRKIALLKVLIAHDLCPPLSDEQLQAWRTRQIYPLTEAFLQWQRTDDNRDKNPYHDRYRALTERLDLNLQSDRYALGRALYHLAQRRGFLSNRKEAGNEKEDGQVKSSIKELTVQMHDASCRYLGEYFYKLYQRKEKIRNHYTARNEHYLAEFQAICDRQQLPETWVAALKKAIFFQRPLKSQKGQVGHCTFERRKSRCPLSHPRYEEFRMLAFINNIRVTTPQDDQPRPLNDAEVAAIRPLFLRKSKPHFDFEEIARKIAGKGMYACKDDRNEAPYGFNFSRTATVSGCPVTAALASLFGDEWLTTIASHYTLVDAKNEEQILNDIWHALFFFDDEERLQAWAAEKLQLSAAEAATFAAIRLPQGYASLSLNAISKMLPYLRRGYRYDEAVFLANLKAVLPATLYADPQKRQTIEAEIAAIIDDYRSDPLNRHLTKEQCVKDYLQNTWDIDATRLERLYHPSMIETYPAAQPDAAGQFRLGSPRTASVRNPMAMRALFRLRALINALLREGAIDRTTKIRIEFSRNLNDANKRKAIEQYQREREREHQKFADEIRRLYAEATGQTIVPSDDDVLKYRLWEEQKHTCPYTGKRIGITDFIGGATSFDIEHTVPRSREGDDSQMNKTLCENRFNRDVKQAKLPAELANHADIMTRIEDFGWQERITTLQNQIEGQIRKSKNAATKAERDNAIQRRHYLKLQLDYWRGKCDRFTMTEVPEGFSNRQGVDIGIIGRYARQYLHTVFEHIYTVKGATTSDFRQMWGIQEEYTKKERSNHVHHCIDAITIACIGPRTYAQWTRYAAQEEYYRRSRATRPVVEKPWPTFTEDVKAIADTLLISHHTPDNMAKQSRKLLRLRGKVKLNARGEKVYVQGDTARGVLHQETFYGAISRDGQIQYVVRKSLNQLIPGEVEKIVDETVKERVKEAIKLHGFKAAMDPTQHTIWMNRDKGIAIRKVRIFAKLTEPLPWDKKQRDLSKHDYKQHYHVANKSNYGMAVYEGTDAKGQTIRTYEIISNWQAAQYFKRSSDKAARPDMVPLTDTHGYPLRWLLKTGTMVLFYEQSPAELYECSPRELAKRLYKVKKMSKDGRVTFMHHQEARNDDTLKNDYFKFHGHTAPNALTDGYSSVDFQYPHPKLLLSRQKFNMYVEGYDFELSVTGKITFKH